MLGRLQLYASRDEIQSCLDKYGMDHGKTNETEFADGYSEPFFRLLGAQEVESIDFSPYENATIIHDMNQPFPDSMKNKFTCIVDGGTIEHIFNFPVAIKNCMEALKTGGHYIGITPANNQMGHGFYQFSPELYFRIFSEENGFRIKKMLIAVDGESNPVWYEVADPAKVKSRVMLVNNRPLALRFIAEKTSEKIIFATTPQQSDYVSTWDSHTSLQKSQAKAGESSAKFYYRKLVPYRLKVILRNLYDIFFKEKVVSADLGSINPDHFRKTDI